MMAERNSSSSPTGSEQGGTTTAGRPAGTSATGTSPSAADSESGMTDRLRDKASSQLNTQKDRATEGLGSVAQAVRQSTKQLREQDHDTLAGYVEQAADQIDRLSRGLRNKDVGELARDAQRFARRRPALFVGSAFAIGLVGARFFKSSAERDEYEYGARYGEYGYGREPAASRGGPFAGGYSREAGTATATGGTGASGPSGTSSPRRERATGRS